MTQQEAFLNVKGLQVAVKKAGHALYPVNAVDLEIPRSTVVGLVGESGCGKSMTAQAILGLSARGAQITGGSVMLRDQELTRCSERELQSIAGNRIAMIFQDPMTSLNPTVRIGKQVEEVLLLHTDLNRAERRRKVIEMLKKVGIPDAEERYRAYPHQLSGGLRQRVVIAMAMICEPELLIADEPTTALDVTIENQILKLMCKLKQEHGTSILLISHNLGVISSMCDIVHVMYLGEIVETAPTASLLSDPMHPYTQGLIVCLPKISQDHRVLSGIPGSVPDLEHIPPGCRFCDRCPNADDRCRQQHPPLADVGNGHLVRCFQCKEKVDQA